MARLKTMTTQFIDGEPNGVRICRCTLSTMTTVFVPRPLLARAKQVSDLPLRGIYYLINDEDGVILGFTSAKPLRASCAWTTTTPRRTFGTRRYCSSPMISSRSRSTT